MNFLWAAYFLSASWLFSSQLYGPFSYVGPLLASLGLFCCVLRRGPLFIHSGQTVQVFVMAAMLPLIWILPSFQKMGPLAIAISAAGLLLVQKEAYVRHRLWGLGVGGFVFMLQTILATGYMQITSRFFELPILAPAVAGLMRLFGAAAVGHGSTLIIRDTWTSNEFFITNERVGLFFLIQLLAALAVMSVSITRIKPVRFLAGVFLAGIGYLVLRLMVLVTIVVETGRHNLFWSEWTAFLSFLPGILLMALVVKQFAPTPASFIKKEIKQDDRPFRVILSTSACVFLTVCAWGLQDPGKVDQKRIIVDEFHSDWEWMQEPYDTSWYGQESGYNYSSLGTFLDAYYQVDYLREEIDSGTLDDFDLLLIKVPTSPFDEKEIKIIHDFVKQGGGLILIGDHTNVFGSSTYLNPIARDLGFYFRYDAAYGLDGPELFAYKSPDIFPHPVVRYLDERAFLFGTPCTFGANFSTQIGMMGESLLAVDLDYTGENFFAKDRLKSTTKFGPSPLLVTASHGKGRVVAFSDSTVFSNFWMFIPGKPELFLGMTEWSLRENRWGWFKPAAFVAGFLCLCATIWLLYFSSSVMISAFSAGCLTFSITVFLVSTINSRSYPPPEMEKSVIKVMFETEHGKWDLPIEGMVMDPLQSFHTFFVWAQRLSYFPYVRDSYLDALSEGDVAVVINPAKTFSEEEQSKSREFVENGGNLIVLLGENSVETVSPLLEKFGLTVQPPAGSPNHSVLTPSGQSLLNGFESLVIEGGKEQLVNESGDAVAVSLTLGKGSLFVLGHSAVFSGHPMGNINTTPSPAQRILYDLVFKVYQGDFSPPSNSSGN